MTTCVYLDTFRGISACFKGGLTVDRAGNVVVADFDRHVLRTVNGDGHDWTSIIPAISQSL
jgi:hypothetical protein